MHIDINSAVRKFRSQAGLTLVELVVTLAVLAILLSIAIPNMRSAIATSQLATNTNDLMGVLAQARMEAIRRGVRVTVCRSTDGAACAASGDWSGGWIAFTDTVRAGNSASVDAGEIIIASGRPSNGIVTVGNASLAQYVSYGPDGSSWLLNGTATQGGTLRVCSTSSSLTDAGRTRDLVIIGSGRVIKQNTSGVSASCPAP